MNRAYSTFEVKGVTDAGGKRTFTGIASTPSTDRMGDIVEPKGAVFKLPLPLLWQHDSGDPVGWITGAKVTKEGIEVVGEVADIPEDGFLKRRLLTAWQMLTSKLVRGLSIGFNPLESARIDGTYGYRFLSWEWLELSAVTIPANQDATIMAIKSADSRYLAAFGRKSGDSLRNVPGASGLSTRTKGTAMKTIAQLREEREQKVSRMKELQAMAAEEKRGLDDEEAIEFDGLEDDVRAIDNESRELRLASLSNTKSVDGSNSGRAAASRGPTIIVRDSDKVEEKFQGQFFTQMVIAKTLAHLDPGMSPSAIAQARWGKSNPMIAQILKANEVAGGGSNSGDWGAELVAADTRYTGDFIEYLTSRTIYDKLPLRQVPANVAIKGQDGTATGYWVGQQQPIPASAQSFSTVSLTPLKVAALAVISNDLLRDSTPSAEMLVRDALVDASSQRVDNTFLSVDAAVSNVSPAGILNGLTAGTSSGTDATGVRNDVKALYRNFITAKNVSGLYLLMHTSQAKAASLLVNALGQQEFPQLTAAGGTLLGDPVVTGDNIEGNHLILLKPSDIYRIGDTGVEVSVSREATIEMSSAPTGEGATPTAQSQAMVSMFQAESTAIKVVRSINFAKRRSTAVAYIRNIDYDGVES